MSNVPPLSRLSRFGIVAIVVAVLVAFWPALRAPFAFDDVGSVVKNPTIEHVFPLSASLSPPARVAVSGRPVVNLSLAVDNAVNAALHVESSGAGKNDATVAFHATNVVIHVLCGLLLFGVVRRTLSSDALGGWANSNAELVALASTGLWLLHPIQTEAVNYVVQRTELLVSLWYLATLYASIRGWDASSVRRRNAWLIAGVAACALGMASKEVMASAPFIVVAYDRVFRASTWRELATNRSRRWFYLGLASTLIVLGALIAGGGRADSVGFGLSLPWYRYLYSQGWAIAHYLLLFAWPADLRFDYGFSPVSGLGGLVGGTIVLALAAAVVLYAARSEQLWPAFLGFWFFAILAPSSSVVPIQTEIAAERRVYLASAAVFVAVIVLAAHALRDRRRLFLASTSVIAALLLVVAFRRSSLYASPEALWRDAMTKAPSNPRAYDNLAAVIYEKDRARIGEADSLWQRGIAIDSTYMPAWSNLAQIRVDQDRIADARALLEHALRISPDYVDATRRLGGLLALQGDTKSIPYLERMANSSEASDEMLVALGQAYIDAARPDDAIATLRRALTLNPRRADAGALLGALLVNRGALAEAVPYLETAAANGDRNAMTFALLSVGYAAQQRADEAEKAAGQAAALGGSDEHVNLTIGRAMVMVARLNEAETYMTRAVQAAPNDPEAVTRLGIVKAARGDMGAAVDLFRRALRISPGYPPAAQALEKAGAKP